MRRIIVGGTAWAAIVLAAVVSGAQPAPGSSSAALPKPVVAAIQRAYQGSVITAAAKEETAGRTFYRIASMDKGRSRTIVATPDGSFVEVADELTEAELPGAVRAAAHSHPRATIAKSARVTRGKDVQYDLILSGTRKTHLIVRPDGTVVSFK